MSPLLNEIDACITMLEVDTCLSTLGAYAPVQTALSEAELEHCVWILKAAYHNGNLLAVEELWAAAKTNAVHAAYIIEHAAAEISPLLD